MLFNGRARIFTFSRTQVGIAEHERLQSSFKMSMNGRHAQIWLDLSTKPGACNRIHKGEANIPESVPCED